MVNIIAHRGASAFSPQNTMPAFLQAYEDGAHVIEIDVRLSSDGVPVVVHDAKIDRLTNGRGKIAEMAYQKLLGYDFGIKSGRPFRGTRIPLLTQVFEFAATTGICLNIEIKNNPLYGFETADIALSLARRYKILDNIYFSSFNFNILRRLKSNDPSVRTAMLFDYSLVDPHLIAKNIGAFAIHPVYRHAIKNNMIEKAVSAGIAVNVWTVDSEYKMRRLIQRGVSGIITNRPCAMHRLINGN